MSFTFESFKVFFLPHCRLQEVFSTPPPLTCVIGIGISVNQMCDSVWCKMEKRDLKREKTSQNLQKRGKRGLKKEKKTFKVKREKKED